MWLTITYKFIKNKLAKSKIIWNKSAKLSSLGAKLSSYAKFAVNVLQDCRSDLIFH